MPAMEIGSANWIGNKIINHAGDNVGDDDIVDGGDDDEDGGDGDVELDAGGGGRGCTLHAFRVMFPHFSVCRPGSTGSCELFLT